MSPTSSSDLRASTPPANGAHNEVKALGLSASKYAQTVPEYIQVIDDLRALGAEAVMNLPGIAVIGNQSAGKSSLVEALSAISVPRNAQTCTRCPMECRLKHSADPWNCQIRLRRKSATSLDANSRNKKNNNAREENFGPLITNKSELELMIRRAQLAILNPKLPISCFVDMSEKALEEGFKEQDQFSQDVVCLDISGPDVTNLSFIDLPGIISYDDEDNVALVENMVKDHIKGNTLILLTITMREDIQLQKAAGLAKEADPQGLRTIGVLTKPDTLQAGEEDAWMKVLTVKGTHGEKYKLHHGYFVTKQPALSELKEKLNHAEARERERMFFESTPPWNTLPARMRARMGVPMLAVELSSQLSQLIAKCLPGLLTEANDSLKETQRKIDALPPPPTENPVIELSRMLTTFANEFNRSVWGAQGHEDISQRCRQTYTAFVQNILSTRPNFVPNAKPVGENTKARGVLLAFETIEEAAGLPCLSEPIFIDELHCKLEGALTRELPFNIPFSAKAKLIHDCFENWLDHCNSCFTAVQNELETHLSALVESHFSRYQRGGLKAHVRRIVEGELKRHAQATKERIKWMLELEDPPFTKNEHYFGIYREKYLSQYREARQKDSNVSAAPTQMPPAPPLRVNNTFFAQPPQAPISIFGSSNNNMPQPSSTFGNNGGGKNKTQAQTTQPAAQYSFTNAFGPTPIGQSVPMDFAQGASRSREEEMAGVLASLTRVGYPVKTEADLARLRDTDPYEQALIVMAEVSAYFRIAYKRIIDNVPRVIDHDFLRALDSSMHGALNKGLGMGERDAYARAENYLRDEDSIVAEREELSRKKERLEEIVERLDRFYV